ncbi:MAG: 5-formyltetrahydrofolate cyclo-ligase [Rhodobacteraceae bacterium]|nr:5-formyltetrahydrofolate cyclo-ligase [Paracoccaceae bacterium]
MSDSGAQLAEAKALARKAALARRRAAFDARPRGDTAALAGVLDSVLAAHRGAPLAGYMPIRTEIDPLPAMATAVAHGPVCVPVIEAAGLPLRFAAWHPGIALVSGTFGAMVPETPSWLRPEVVIVPLVAFDAQGGRLGYGGGFYDRTLEGLRATGPVLAIGFAFGAQLAEDLPLEPTDQKLDMIVTERDVIRPR